MTTTNKRYDILDLETGELDRRIFIDQDIYDEEMDKIFGRTWLMVAHESLVPEKNDFFLSYMGEDSVIVTRDENMKVHVLLNMCRHRGNRVVRADDGNAQTFMCTYHGWTFSNDGCLGHIPGEQEAYYGHIDKDKRGLYEARVGIYAGIVFACWDQEAPSLEDYLGDARWYLDSRFNRFEGGMIALGPQKWMEPCNWKTPVDNCSDNYHVPITHYSSSIAANKMYGLPMATMETSLAAPNRNHHVFVNGHALTFRSAPPTGQHPVRRGVTPENKAAFDAWEDMSEGEAVARLGEERARELQLGNHSLFPNTVLGFRLAHPRGPLKTEFWHFALVPKDAPEEVRNAMQNATSQFNGAAGVFEQDDIDNWRQVTEASKSPIARRLRADISMGINHSGPSEEWPGEHSERYISENNQRHFYQRWMEFMNADSWNDVHVEPQTATYEGTATFEGPSKA
jgi:phenylpropionate dioxygenase-like ring-hydroxylating dioxygenase large terminal subunit